MEHSPSEIVAQHLLSVEEFSHPKSDNDWKLYFDQLPPVENTGDTSAAVHDTTGIIDHKSHKTKITHRHYGINIMIRSRTHKEGFKKAEDTLDILSQVVGERVIVEDTGDYTINSLKPTTPTIVLGLNKDERCHRFSLNFLASITDNT